MFNPTVRISERAHRTLKELTSRTGQTMQTILDRAIEEERRRQFFAEVDAAYGSLRSVPEAWADYKAEAAAWDSTLMDGLDPEEHHEAPAPAARRTARRRA